MATVLPETKAQILYQHNLPTSIGECVLLSTQSGICWLGLPGSTLEEGITRTKRWITIERVVEDTAILPLKQAVDELQRYFAGERLQFSCPLDMQGTPFQLQVWRELSRIPYGETRSYGEIALAIGRPTASRAVGAANGANPIAIIVPCHRVIGSNGSLTGYGGGLPTKSWLLALEGIRHK
ncbi:MAG: methylated-DNA--[protein]-cysteine S-methyltransferase [Ktedonobacteraceae bacterium]|nr:methylated-DNA--[protein]-cysteine S-methyltransferase [Ktedonobacteraceae bacterium]